MNGTLAPKDLGGILGETFTIYKNNFLRLIAIVAIVQVPYAILNAVSMSLGFTSPDASGTIIRIVSSIAMLVASVWMAGAVIHAVSEQYFSRPVSIGRAYGFAWHRLEGMFWAGFLAYLAIGAVFLAALLISTKIAPDIGGTGSLFESLFGWIIWLFVVIAMAVLISAPAIIYLQTKWAFIFPTALLEGCGPRAALSHSWALVKGNWWRIFGIMLLLALIVQTISMIFYTPALMGYLNGMTSGAINESSGGFTPYVTSESSISIIWAAIAAAIGNIITLPIVIIGLTLLYFDLRVRKQGYSLDTLAGELGLSKPPTDTADTAVISPPV